MFIDLFFLSFNVDIYTLHCMVFYLGIWWRPVMGPGEPGLVPEGGHRRVQERMEAAESEGFSWELHRTPKR